MRSGHGVFYQGELAAARTHFGAGAGPLRPAAAPCPGRSLWGRTPGCAAGFWRPVPCGCWAIRTQARAVEPGGADPGARGWRTPSAWREALGYATCSREFRREARLRTRRRRPPWPSRTEHRVCATGWCRDVMLRGGPWPCRAHGEEGLAQLRQGLEAYRATGAAVQQPYDLALAGRGVCEGTSGRAPGLAVLAEALAVLDDTGGVRLGGGAVSAPGGAAAQQARRDAAHGGGSLFPPGPRRLPAASRPSPGSCGPP